MSEKSLEVNNIISCYWVEKLVHGDPPPPRQGHAIATKTRDNQIFLFGGSSHLVTDSDEPTFYNDFYCLTVCNDEAFWVEIDQHGDIPSARDQHHMCCIGNKIYLYGGKDDIYSDDCLPGLYIFHIGSNKWEKVETTGTAPTTVGHTLNAVGRYIYVFAGISSCEATNDLHMLNTELLSWVKLDISGMVMPEPRCDHAATVVGHEIYIFGGCGGPDIWYNDVFIFDTATLSWSKPKVRGDVPLPRGNHTFTAHHRKDIYVFGGSNDSSERSNGIFQDVFKLSLAKNRWKAPSVGGLKIDGRYGHVATVLHSQLIIFGGVDESTEFDDLRFLRLLNPSERTQDSPQYKGISRTMTKPDNSYALGIAPYTRPQVPLAPPATKKTVDISELERQAEQSLTDGFRILKEQMEKIEIDRENLESSKLRLMEERKLYEKQFEEQQKDLHTVLTNHEETNEAWLEDTRRELEMEWQRLSVEKQKVAFEKQQVQNQKAEIRKRSVALYDSLKKIPDFGEDG